MRSLIITQENRTHEGLCKSLTENGLACSVTPYNRGVIESVASQQPNIVLLETGKQLPDAEMRKLIHGLRNESNLPVIALNPREMLERPESDAKTSGPPKPE